MAALFADTLPDQPCPADLGERGQENSAIDFAHASALSPVAKGLAAVILRAGVIV
ncbi:hypothetical protein [Alloactinosynnema sp. L-07]|uniref:hypothetical protein n=1 Tax=Alloactinosynnema sp. L-07 TaxID=1653480 RepID=UPI0012F98CA6|nr:hypothetical protein [Alloactinosynnema sp. L-07]